MVKVKIADILIGDGAPCFIIAEAGVNHNGDISLARKLIEMAKDAGADAVKFQTFKTEEVVTKSAGKAEYQKKTTGTKETQYEMIKKLELPEEAHFGLKSYADNRGIMFLSTPYDEGSVDFLSRLGVAALKISSADITNHPLLSYIAAKNLPVILSTGMSTLGEVEEALVVITKSGNDQVVLLHCNFNYPARIEDMNLRAMATIKQAFGFPVGFSDHTMGIEISLAAVAMGAVVIEKHFTLDRNMAGPDHRSSLEPDELKEMVSKIRNIEKALGSNIKKPTGPEIKNRLISRRSLVAGVIIEEGTIITGDMLKIKRPGTGIPPKYLNDVIGRKATKSIRQDELIIWNKVGE
ncbi:N-acetylneuraminate synthase [Chloroflexota bacterium]